MKTVTVGEFEKILKGQGVPLEDVKFRCPRCKTEHSAKDLIEAGVGKDLNEVEKYLAFSCIGRWTKEKGCDWTLGGLFHIHIFEVETLDGKKHP